jgi:glycosyltransferase involved in cell wall biosynthesis
MDTPLYVEVTSLLTRHLTGIGRFVARLLEALAPRTPLRLVTTMDRLRARSTNLSTALLVGREAVVDGGGLRRADEDLTKWVRRLLRMPQGPHDARLAARSPGLYTMLRPAERHFGRELAILYDFTPLLLPWTHQRDTCLDFGDFFSRTAQGCDKLVAISHSTRADARWLCPVPQQDIVVGYPGPSMCVRSHAHPQPTRREDNTILVVSTREPRKNARFLLDWFFETNVVPAGTRLLWAGSDGWLWHLGRRKGIAAAGRRVEFLGMVSDARLCELYRRATLTIYPSLYEGFGFPVLDALRHGTPVLCSYNSSLQEFDGLGARFFDSCDATSLDEAFTALWEELRGGTYQSAEQDVLDERFSWDQLADTVLALCA